MPVDCDAFLYGFRPNDGKEYRAIPHMGAPGGYIYKPVEPRSTYHSTNNRYEYSSTQPTSPPSKTKKIRCCMM